MTATIQSPVALVTGAAGIVGYAVAKELERQGWRVRALGRRVVPGFETITVSLGARRWQGLADLPLWCMNGLSAASVHPVECQRIR